MTREIFRRGGPHNIQKTGPNEYKLSVTLPSDAAGFTLRKCPLATCSPALYKIKYGTGVKGKQARAYCPYCRKAAAPDDFATSDQIRYAKDILTNEMHDGVNRVVQDALGIRGRGTRKIGGDLFSIEMKFKPGARRPVRRPWEEQFRRDVTCPNCTLEHAVYGLAVWCPDCGEDIFLTHVETETQVVRAMLNDVGRRSEQLSPRVAARDIENSLEDVVSILEATLKAMVRRRLVKDGSAPEEASETIRRKVRNRLQSFDGAVAVMKELFGLELQKAADSSAIEQLRHTLEKRHPITHNLGIVDRKYLEKVRTGEVEGRDVNLYEDEVLNALDTVLVLIGKAHSDLFPDPPTA